MDPFEYSPREFKRIPGTITAAASSRTNPMPSAIWIQRGILNTGCRDGELKATDLESISTAGYLYLASNAFEVPLKLNPKICDVSKFALLASGVIWVGECRVTLRLELKDKLL